ncbi:Nitric oxide -responding transcriptional regulator NnrR (Crp/Fnr family) [Rubellimicrobium mesophilum DSM 19309]|uniref:Nitric oxide-responding transcriptional regulator NnrR (Crp/Fnr family) n=1 Tax=Rubellimicrobium mesophilum DSM 19309 TaxID=442562 RepID=A0A017HEU7_9RHOB|nr:Crp/Fnr family transcriptional regulator [Rubellimicrobium mesophilum]EYD72886.1 Nitric oxide -responding transcriptional regulator NnrR (Crp/Fnr family) [Rubellimicrobium mesophilum DSM 19309]
MAKKLDAKLLSGLPPFSRLAPDQIREILDQGTSRHHDEGTAVFHEGHDADRFYLLLDGYVRVMRTLAGGEQVVLRHIPPGQLIGIAPALRRTTYPATALTVTEALTLSWPTRLWGGFMSRYEGFATETWATVGARLEQAHDQVAELATRAVEQRIAACLLRMVNQTGRKVAGGVEIAFPLSRANIAEMTGTSLFTVSRTLSAWERDGVIESSRKHILVTDPHRLLLLSDPKG